MSKFGARVSRASRGPPRYPCVALSMRGTRAAQRGHAPNAGVLTALASERSSISSVIVPADGTRAATADFGTSAFFGQLSDKPLLACIWSHGVRTPKRNGWWKIKRWAPSWRIAVVQLINWLGARSFEFNRAALAFPDDTGAAPAMGRERAAPEPPGPGEAPLSS